MFSMYDVVTHLGLKRLLGGGRMSGYHKKANDMTPATRYGSRGHVICFFMVSGHASTTHSSFQILNGN